MFVLAVQSSCEPCIADRINNVLCRSYPARVFSFFGKKCKMLGVVAVFPFG